MSTIPLLIRVPLSYSSISHHPGSLLCSHAAHPLALAQALHPNAFGAILDTLVVDVQRHLKGSKTKCGAFRDPTPYPPVLVALKLPQAIVTRYLTHISKSQRRGRRPSRQEVKRSYWRSFWD